MTTSSVGALKPGDVFRFGSEFIETNERCVVVAVEPTRNHRLVNVTWLSSGSIVREMLPVARMIVVINEQESPFIDATSSNNGCTSQAPVV